MEINVASLIERKVISLEKEAEASEKCTHILEKHAISIMKATKTSQYNCSDKLLIIRLVNKLRTSHHNNTICKVKVYTNIIGNDKVDRLATQGVE